jgi:hypothetical protein
MPMETRVGLFASVRHAIRNNEAIQQAKERLGRRVADTSNGAADYEIQKLADEQREREHRARRSRWGA